MGIEFAVLTLNMIVLVIAYGLLNPSFAGNCLRKILMQDVMALSVSLLVIGTSFMNTTLNFTLLAFNVNWFWFTLLTFIILQVPMFIWYAKRWQVMFSR
ncbi:hypothetical protein J8L98_22790 [Pseudoalteromonas sp. MMG013]|uniref:hypothetical protein n=1 Tax=unclassified Pseudoalteromonas TaxID=194690 RepID=UPI001B372919|nr:MULTISPECIES: hypothetical protein [unclassified Pseudoalteromonas]MBQ4847559.1 hypothetical protein [Pseudoalteromonas sp. MMG005]MBQ4851498.1 hypothetical protein [Pseudoalteromonas sp. MMG012]MBQ4864516.1 hypothetical protein [Pseudoalteromonas sp. MMG013]